MENKDKIYDLTEKDITPEGEIELSELLRPYKDGSVALVQLDSKIGDLEYNAKKIVKYVRHAQNIGIELVIFPELALTGFPLEDTVSRHPMLVQENIKWLDQIAKIVTKTTVIVGFIEPSNVINKYYNSVAVLEDGKISTIVRKSLCPSDMDFNDCRHTKFPQNENKILKIKGKNVAVLIGDDLTVGNSETNKFFNEKPEYVINCSASALDRIKSQCIESAFSFAANKYGVPIINVNQAGSTDGIIFEGASSVYNSEGMLIARAKSLEEHFLIINPQKGLTKIYPSIFDNEKTTTSSEENFSLNYEPELERVYKTIIKGIKDYFRKTGFEKAVLGLSGGLDSTVCAVLLADALGKENVLGISMPSKITSDESKNDAKILAQNLGINFAQIPIKEMFETTNTTLQNLFKSVESSWNNRYSQSYTSDNIQARSRAVILWGVSNEFGKCLPIATSDKSEAYVGYATINGDMSGGFAPIADVTKTKLFALARWMNANREQKNVIPESVIMKRPGAELAIDPKTGKPLIAEDALMPYEFLDEIIWRIECKKENYDQMLNSEFLYEKKNNISKEQKLQWLDKFYRRMSGALYKWTILPPKVMIDTFEYRQPITSCGINYKGLSEKEIEEIISKV